MKINRDNYEAYFLDYHEGQLSPEMEAEVLLFVELNPDLKSTLEEFDPITLDADQESIVFERKQFLKKNQVLASSSINDLNYVDFLIGEAEGLLNDEQHNALEEFLRKNPRLEKDRKLVALTRLEIDHEVVFEAKESLKQKAIKVGPIDSATFETYLARELEDDLNVNEKAWLEEFMLFNPHLQNDRNLYKHTILTIDSEIVYPDKQKLKKSVTPLRQIVYYTLSAAASLALIMSIYFILGRNDVPKSIAKNGNDKITIEEQVVEPADIITENQVTSTNQQVKEKETNLIDDENISTVPSSTGGMLLASQDNLSATSVDRQSLELVQTRQIKKVTTRQFVDPQFIFIRKSQMYMNEQIEFYYNLKLAEEIQYAQLNAKDKNPGKTIFKAATGQAEELFTKNQKTPEKDHKKNVSLWTFAELGVQTFNTVTSSDLELNLRKDDEGKVVAYGLQGGILDFEKEVKK